MQFDGVVLYGPPASGKDTITAALTEISDTYRYFQKLKVGSGRTAGYRMASREDVTELRTRGAIVHEVSRYNATYVVDSDALADLVDSGRVPIVHMGQMAGVQALQQYGVRWLDVLLWCPKDITEDRLRGRGSADLDARLAVWDETKADLGALPEMGFTVAIRTDRVTATSAAGLIDAAVRAGR
jgi:guanylate kinase